MDTSIPDHHFYSKWCEMSDFQKFATIRDFMLLSGWRETDIESSLFYHMYNRDREMFAKIPLHSNPMFHTEINGLLLMLGLQHTTDPLRGIKTFLTMVVSQEDKLLNRKEGGNDGICNDCLTPKVQTVEENGTSPLPTLFSCLFCGEETTDTICQKCIPF